MTSRRKLTSVLLGLVVLGVLVSGVAAERSLRRDRLDRVARSLEERAALVAEQVRGATLEGAYSRQLDLIADRLGKAGGMRLTFIDAEGTVVGDSQVPHERLAGVENHGDRTEVRAALDGRVGTSTRRSATVGRELFYLAHPVEGGGVVRVAVDLSELEAAVAALRARLLFAGVVGLVVAVGLSYGISRYSLRTIEEMRRTADAIARGRLEDRLPLHTDDELGQISRSINQMAEQLRLRLDDVTREKEQLHAVLESMVEGVLVVDAKGTVVLANSRLREFYRVPSEIVGRPLLETIRDAELDELLREVAQSDDRVARSLSKRSGAPGTLRVQASRFPTGPGPRAGTVAVFHDISELERLEEVRRDFVANASHELRTPLTAIHGFAETLLTNEGLSEDDRRSYLGIIDRHSQRLGNIVNDLLALSAIERGRVPIEPTDTDVSSHAEMALRDAEPRCRERRLEVRCVIDGTPIAHVDPRALDQILTNLLDNAIKYTEPGGRIEVRVGSERDRIRVEVEDSGIGIPDEDLTRIFERFYRVDKARSRALGGTGLGLSIVKHAVQSMGGEISVESRLGEGTTFSFTLPVARIG
jgi:two-component system phosphate regulon sensor histidine kinase PhoR